MVIMVTMMMVVMVVTHGDNDEGGDNGYVDDAGLGDKGVCFRRLWSMQEKGASESLIHSTRADQLISCFQINFR